MDELLLLTLVSGRGSGVCGCLCVDTVSGEAGVDHIELREVPCTCTRICMYHSLTSCDVIGAPSLLAVYAIRSHETLVMNSRYMYCCLN